MNDDSDSFTGPTDNDILTRVGMTPFIPDADFTSDLIRLAENEVTVAQLLANMRTTMQNLEDRINILECDAAIFENQMSHRPQNITSDTSSAAASSNQLYDVVDASLYRTDSPSIKSEHFLNPHDDGIHTAIQSMSIEDKENEVSHAVVENTRN